MRMLHDGSAVAGDIAREALTTGTAAPGWAGGGYWFAGGHSLYHATQFLGSLQPKLGLPEAAHSVAFGPDFLLVTLDSGNTVAVDPGTLSLRTAPVAGMYDVVALADGRALALADPGMVWTRSGDGKWKNATAAVHGRPTDIRVAEGRLLLSSETTEYRLEKDGALSRIPAPNKSTTSPHAGWPDTKMSPLQAVVTRGVLLDDDTAVVLVQGRVAKVRLPQGRLLSISPPALPSDAECWLSPEADDVLAACSTRDRLFVASRLLRKPEVERSFPKPGYFVSSYDGGLAFAGGCTPSDSKAIRMCVRTSRGQWREIGGGKEGAPSADAGATADAGSTSMSAERVTRFALGTSGQVVALIGGNQPGLYDVTQARFEAFSKDGWRQVPGLLRAPGSGSWVLDNIQVDASGSILGYQDNKAFRLDRDGAVELSLHAFTRLQSSGARAYATDRTNVAWQSVDYGRHFRPVGTAPLPQLYPATSCSHAGCDLSLVYRLGWRSDSNASPAYREAAEPRAATLPRLPRLACRTLAPPSFSEAHVRVAPNTDEPLDVLDLGAHTLPLRGQGDITELRAHLPGEDEQTRALWLRSDRFTDAEGPALAALLRRPITFRFAPLFDPDGKSHAARALLAQASQLFMNASQPEDTRVNLESLVTGGIWEALPVLTARAFDSELALANLDVELLMTLHETRTAQIVAASVEVGDNPLQSVARTADGRLWGAAEWRNCSTMVNELGLRARRGFVLPERARLPCPRLNVLGLRDAKVHVVQLGNVNPPTSHSPALELAPKEPAAALAPWERMTPANAPECKGHSGLRVLVATDQPWLELDFASSEAEPPESWLLVLGTWDQQRLCVEALETAAPSFTNADEELPARIVVRFESTPRAARVGIDQGIEGAEPLRCELTVPPR
ncbi:MAG: hypothetical protein R3B13_10730 [Polyangiaceae bacterium]